MKRRTVLAGAAAAMGTQAVAAIGRLAPRAAAVAGLPSRDRLWRWVEGLNAFGPRLTGSPAHGKSIDYLAGELSAIGLTVHRDTHKMTRWTPKRSALMLSDGAAIAVAAPYPYSGRTDAAGVTAPLVWFDAPGDFARARGKIAVVSVARHDLDRATVDALFLRTGHYPNADADFMGTSPLLGALLAGFVGKARAAGVVGVVCVYAGVSPGEAKDEVLPFTTPYADCPALWVDAAQGERLRHAAASGQAATLVLEEDIAPAATDTLYAILPGATDRETIVVNTHTDGPNACEENGAAGLLALAQTQVARKDRRRMMIFVMVTGHFQIPQFSNHGQATTAWLDAHPELWDGKDGHAHAVAGLTIEHLGCMEWKDDLAAGGPKPTGKIDLEIVYTTNPAMQRVFAEAAADRTLIRTVTVAPRTERMFGEGSPLYNVGIPTISMVPSPDYLCQLLPNGGIERLNPDLAHQQVQTFARALLALDAMPSEAIGRAVPSIA